MSWTFLARFPRSHRYFRDEHGVAIASPNEKDPDDAENGPYYLDLRRPIAVAGNTLHLPMTTKSGEGRFFVGATVAEALWVAAQCKLLIFSRAQDALYRVAEQSEQNA